MCQVSFDVIPYLELLFSFSPVCSFFSSFPLHTINCSHQCLFSSAPKSSIRRCPIQHRTISKRLCNLTSQPNLCTTICQPAFSMATLCEVYKRISSFDHCQNCTLHRHPPLCAMAFPALSRCSISLFFLWLTLSSLVGSHSSSSSSPGRSLADPDPESIDEIRAYVESFVNDPASPYRAAINSQLNDVHPNRPFDLSSSMPSSPGKEPGVVEQQPQQFCSADGPSAAACALSSALPLASSSPDLSGMQLTQLMDQLVSLSQQYPEEIDAIIENYKQMLHSLDS